MMSGSEYDGCGVQLRLQLDPNLGINIFSFQFFKIRIGKFNHRMASSGHCCAEKQALGSFLTDKMTKQIVGSAEAEWKRE